MKHETPKHYNKPVTPWDLQRHMDSSGDAFIDARRTDAIEYCYRMKGDLIGDLRKARHCIEAAIQKLETNRAKHRSRLPAKRRKTAKKGKNA